MQGRFEHKWKSAGSDRQVPQSLERKGLARLALELRCNQPVPIDSLRMDGSLRLLTDERGTSENVRPGADPRPGGRKRRSFLTPALILFALGAGVFLAAISLRSRGAAIRALPALTRSQLLQDGLLELGSICREPALEGPLREHCLGEARLLLALPECGSACQNSARAILPHGCR
jgi:hypothetical protein